MEALRRVQDAHADLLATASMTVVPGSVQDEYEIAIRETPRPRGEKGVP